MRGAAACIISECDFDFLVVVFSSAGHLVKARVPLPVLESLRIKTPTNLSKPGGVPIIVLGDFSDVWWPRRPLSNFASRSLALPHRFRTRRQPEQDWQDDEGGVRLMVQGEVDNNATL